VEGRGRQPGAAAILPLCAAALAEKIYIFEAGKRHILLIYVEEARQEVGMQQRERVQEGVQTVAGRTYGGWCSAGEETWEGGAGAEQRK